MASHSVIPRDTQFLHAALHNWQERNHTDRTFLELSPAEQSEIMGDAQDLKKETPLSVDEVLDGVAITKTQSRAWYELQAVLAATTRIRQEVIQ
jgi:hypothetical protein